MARPTTTAQSNALAAKRRLEFVAVWVENADHALVDVTALAGQNWFRGAEIEMESADTPIAQATVKLLRDDGGTRSLSPLRSDSTLNRDGSGAFAPAVDVGRQLKINVAVLDPAVSTSPVAGDWQTLFDGVIDTVDPAKHEMVVVARDVGGTLADAWLDQEHALIVDGSGVTMSLEDAVQATLDASRGGIGAGGVTLYTPVPSGISVTRWGWHREPCFDAITRNVEAFGWSCRFRWDATTGAFRLTLFHVDRTKTTPDLTLGAGRYTSVDSLKLTRLMVRNQVIVYYGPASGTGPRASVTREDVPSQVKYGVRPIIDEEGSDSPINTATEAGALADALLADLKDPLADRTTTLPLDWRIESTDLIRFTANGVHADSDQDLAVNSIRHSLPPDNKACSTQLMLRGKPAGAYRSWHARARTRNRAEEDVTLSDLRQTDGDTTSVISFVKGLDVAEVWAAFTVVAVPVDESDWDTVVAALAPLGVDSITVTRPADQQATLVQLVPYRNDGSAGTVVRRVLYGLPQVPTAEYDDVEDGTTGTQWIRLTERGIAVVSVEAQLQYEDSTFTVFAVPTRGPGDASVVKGGTLGPNEYEQDVPLSSVKGRQTFIRFQWTLANTRVITSPDFAFDADQLPNLVSVIVEGTTVRATGDSDTKSMLVGRSDGVWQVAVDGKSISVDVAQPDPDGDAGLASGDANTFAVQAWNVPAAFRVGAPVPGRAYDERAVRVTNGAIAGDGSTVASWLTVTATAPAADGTSSDITIGLKANAAPSGWTVKLLISTDGSVPSVDRTSAVSPTLSAPPTSLTSYTWDTGYASIAPGGLTPWAEVTVRLKAELLDGSSAVRDTRDVTVSFYVDRSSL